MNIAQLHQDEDLRRYEFPVAQHTIFLAHAAVCPLPRRVVEAVAQCARAGALDDQEEAVPRSFLADTREAAARLIGAQPDEIALVGPTSLGLSFVAAGLPWRKGDNLLIYHDDYPSNVYPWMALADRGIEVRLMNVRELGRIRNVDVLGQVDEQTRLVALASCHFISGWKLDLPALGRALRQRGILFCLDAIQTLGAMPVSVESVDFLAADAHKWLLGPCGAGLFYVRRAVQERLRPVVFGWHNVRCPDFVAQDHLAFAAGARRYEAGSASLLGIAGLKAALDLLLETGVEAIAAELQRKRAWLAPALEAKGWTVLHPAPPPEHAGPILSFYREREDMAAWHQRLKDAGIATSLRADRGGRRYLRLSPHFYNTDAELHRLLELL